MHGLTPAAELLHGVEEVVNYDAGYQDIAKRPEMAGKPAEFRVALRPAYAGFFLTPLIGGCRI